MNKFNQKSSIIVAFIAAMVATERLSSCPPYSNASQYEDGGDVNGTTLLDERKYCYQHPSKQPIISIFHPYPVHKDFKILANHIITKIIVLLDNPEHVEQYVSVLRGGVGSNNVLVMVENQDSSELNCVVKIYGIKSE